MKINQKILSIPPYISTSWKNVISLHIEEKEETVLVIGLVNGSTIEIPGLDQKILKAAFTAHEKFLEQETTNPPHGRSSPTLEHFLPPEILKESSAILSLPVRFGFGSNVDHLLQHNPQAAESPDLPPEMLKKIASLSKSIGLENVENFPKPEPHCNCAHCQVMRAIQGEEQKNEIVHEEEVTEEDLRFRDWEITQKGENLFVVTNPLNLGEHYDVFIGSPVGCTCGQKNCEHLKAVLNS